MTKILFLITGFDYAGAENQVVQLCRGFKAKGCSIQIISMIKPVAYLDELKELDVPIMTLDMQKGIPDPRALLKLRKLIKAFKPDIVHSHLVHANIMARAVRLLVRIPVLICTAHNINEGGKLREWLYRITDPLCELTTNVSQEAVNRYVAIKAAPEHKIIFVPNGINMDKFAGNPDDGAAIREELQLGSRYIWLAVGRFVPEKDYGNMLQSFAEVLRTKPDSALLIAGIGPERLEAEQLAETLGLAEHVQFLGIRTDIPKLMHAADGYLMSSQWEGLPIVLLEAAASALPVVTTNVGGNSEVVHDEVNGYLVPHSDSRRLAAAMDKLMSLTPDERTRMGESGRQYVEKHYNMDYIIERWEQIYAQYRR
ncbi:glycosyltransferase [Paenibacillus sp. YAF4_2]|uniref:glycosyltransferase n=1 Tax=Paenibacillus sp. YAF4_2 TaxID=3233085 RepID=UPI003F9E224E